MLRPTASGVKPYINGTWYGQLEDINYFNSVTTDGYTVVWPDEIYELSVIRRHSSGCTKRKA